MPSASIAYRPNPEDFNGRSMEIKSLIARRDLEEATKRLLDLTCDFCDDLVDAVIMLKGELFQLNKDHLMSTIKEEDFKISFNKIAAKILRTIKTIKHLVLSL